MDCGYVDLFCYFETYGGDMNRIDLIIENIEYAKLLKEVAHQDELLDEALAAARELKALKPVAWMSQGGDASRSANYFKEMGFTNLIALYALDEVTK
jgi:hypothetical protein